MRIKRTEADIQASILACVQLFTFTLALCILALVSYAPTRSDEVEKSKHSTRSEVETSLALPKTLQAQTELMPLAGSKVPMYAVYGRDSDDRKIWCATFIDSDEAMAWVQASKIFGRAVRGAVLAQQPGVVDGTGTDSGAAAEKPN